MRKMATYTDLAAFVLEGDPRTFFQPKVMELVSADVEDDGGGINNTTDTNLEEYTFGSFTGGVQTISYNGNTYELSGRVGDDVLQITSGGTLYEIDGWIVEASDEVTGEVVYLFFIENTETIPSLNYGVDYVSGGGVNNGASMPYGSVLSTPVCFTSGTLIRTIDGLVAAEEIEQGDMVWTKDDGYQPVRWVGHRYFDGEALSGHENLRPIRIKRGALGNGLPERDLRVSQQHRMLVNSSILERMTGDDEALVAAKHLLQINGIDVDHKAQGVTYIHFLFDRHQIVEAEGAESESLFTGPEALKSVSPEARKEIFAIFPELMDTQYDKLEPARPILSGRKGKKLAQRHKQNRKFLLSSQL